MGWKARGGHDNKPKAITWSSMVRLFTAAHGAGMSHSAPAPGLVAGGRSPWTANMESQTKHAAFSAKLRRLTVSSKSKGSSWISLECVRSIARFYPNDSFYLVLYVFLFPLFRSFMLIVSLPPSLCHLCQPLYYSLRSNRVFGTPPALPSLPSSPPPSSGLLEFE